MIKYNKKGAQVDAGERPSTPCLLLAAKRAGLPLLAATELTINLPMNSAYPDIVVV